MQLAQRTVSVCACVGYLLDDLIEILNQDVNVFIALLRTYQHKYNMQFVSQLLILRDPRHRRL